MLILLISLYTYTAVAFSSWVAAVLKKPVVVQASAFSGERSLFVAGRDAGRLEWGSAHGVGVVHWGGARGSGTTLTTATLRGHRGAGDLLIGHG